MYNIDKKENIRTFKLFYTGGSSMKKIRNILSLALVFIMLIGLMPMNVFAEPSDPPEKTEETGGGNQGKTEETDLQKAQKAAKTTVEGLENLTPEEKKGFTDKIDAATEVDKIQPIVDEAKAADTKALNDAKAKAKKDVEDLANKDEAIKAIEAANTVADVKAAVTKAQEDAKKAEEKKEELAKAKKDAIQKVKALSDLSEANKTAAEQAINAAKDKDTVAAELGKAQALDDAKTAAKAEVDKLSEEKKKAAIEAIDKAKTLDEVKKAVEEAKKEKPVTPTPTKTVNVVTYGNGTASVDNENAINRQLVTVTAKPYSGYVVDSIVVIDGQGKKLNLFNEKYKNYYYDDYPYYLRSRWYRGYDYDDYISWCNGRGYSRYDYSSFKRWCNWNGYSYDYDDFKRFCDWDDIYDYGWYNRYDYSYLNQADFVMPNSAVTVEVTFTSAPYWYDGYFYDYETGTYRRYYGDDYYYYRYRRNKKDNYYERQKKAEEKAKEEEEAKAKAEAAKQPQIYENKAVISIGSNILDKVSKNVHTVHEMDTPAYVNNGRVMLPLRFVAEALGLQVSWVPETKTVIIWDLTQRVEIPVKSNRIIVNGITYTSDVKPEIKSSRTMLPIANIARALGLIDGSDIVWDQYNKQVTLTRKVLSK